MFIYMYTRVLERKLRCWEYQECFQHSHVHIIQISTLYECYAAHRLCIKFPNATIKRIQFIVIRSTSYRRDLFLILSQMLRSLRSRLFFTPKCIFIQSIVKHRTKIKLKLKYFSLNSTRKLQNDLLRTSTDQRDSCRQLFTCRS